MAGCWGNLRLEIDSQVQWRDVHRGLEIEIHGNISNMKHFCSYCDGYFGAGRAVQLRVYNRYLAGMERNSSPPMYCTYGLDGDRNSRP